MSFVVVVSSTVKNSIAEPAAVPENVSVATPLISAPVLNPEPLAPLKRIAPKKSLSSTAVFVPRVPFLLRSNEIAGEFAEVVS